MIISKLSTETPSHRKQQLEIPENYIRIISKYQIRIASIKKKISSAVQLMKTINSKLWWTIEAHLLPASSKPSTMTNS